MGVFLIFFESSYIYFPPYPSFSVICPDLSLCSYFSLVYHIKSVNLLVSSFINSLTNELWRISWQNELEFSFYSNAFCYYKLHGIFYVSFNAMPFWFLTYLNSIWSLYWHNFNIFLIISSLICLKRSFCEFTLHFIYFRVSLKEALF